MDAHFWHERWQDNRIGFHAAQANPLLVAHFASLALAPDSRVFLPLCGKTLDIGWLLAQGHRVAGAELSRLAIDQLFDQLGVTPTITQRGALIHYAAPRIDMFVGDIFDLSAQTLAPVDAIYDRAALVALPEDMRLRYGAHVAAISGQAPQLLICFEYAEGVINGPPFSLDPGAIGRVYDGKFTQTLLERRRAPAGRQGLAAADETIWLLR